MVAVPIIPRPERRKQIKLGAWVSTAMLSDDSEKARLDFGVKDSHHTKI
jgi:hypothetical protein